MHWIRDTKIYKNVYENKHTLLSDNVSRVMRARLPRGMHRANARDTELRSPVTPNYGRPWHRITVARDTELRSLVTPNYGRSWHRITVARDTELRSPVTPNYGRPWHRITVARDTELRSPVTPNYGRPWHRITVARDTELRSPVTPNYGRSWHAIILCFLFSLINFCIFFSFPAWEKNYKLHVERTKVYLWLCSSSCV